MILIKIAMWLMGESDYLLVASNRKEGVVSLNADKEGREHIIKVIVSALRNADEAFKDTLLDAIAEYLQPLEIESRNFINRIK